jgi:DNA (cytosine-5)-methyltransferase 1
MKILNLYAGIGGNRKYWNDVKSDIEVTAVELDPKIAEIYQDFFPNDKVIVADAHKYLEDHYKEFDFIWSSPPCPTHSRFNNLSNVQEGKKMKFPDMKLYEEIIFLKHWFKGKWCIENVISYYKPLIPPTESCSHYFWTNFLFPAMDNVKRGIKRENEQDLVREKIVGFDLEKYNLQTRYRRKLINNCVEPEAGKQILEYVINPIKKQKEIFDFID